MNHTYLNPTEGAISLTQKRTDVRRRPIVFEHPKIVAKNSYKDNPSTDSKRTFHETQSTFQDTTTKTNKHRNFLYWRRTRRNQKISNPTAQKTRMSLLLDIVTLEEHEQGSENA